MHQPVERNGIAKIMRKKRISSGASNNTRHWTRDELILALDVYVRLSPRTPDPHLPDVIALSRLLRSERMRPTEPRSPNFRSPASVVMKLMNFRSLDSAFKGKGLTAGGQLDRVIWNTFAEDRSRLKKVAEAIRSVLGSIDTDPKRLDDLITEAEEGAILTRLHRQRERNSRLVESKKQSVFDAGGRLSCEVCGFTFSEVYGQIGEGYIECHHKLPLADFPSRRKTALSDLALVCANCHRMMHGARPWLSVEQLAAVVASNRGVTT
jgi:5-methylcytosine-specific restriction enzyme A